MAKAKSTKMEKCEVKEAKKILKKHASLEKDEAKELKKLMTKSKRK